MLKEFKYLFLYFWITFLFLINISFTYISYFILGISNFLDEALILNDSVVWIWIHWNTGFYIYFWLSLPYLVFLINVWAINKNTLFGIFVLNLYFSLFFYTGILSALFFITDLFDSTFFLPNIKNISYEFQPEIEHYFNLFFGFFFDLLKSFVIFQILFWFFLTTKKIYLSIEKYFFLIEILILTLFYYWFGGESVISDVFLCFLIIITNQFLIYNFFIIKQFRRYKKFRLIN